MSQLALIRRLHGAFLRGKRDHLNGIPREPNPYQKKQTPREFRSEWTRGWDESYNDSILRGGRP